MKKNKFILPLKLIIVLLIIFLAKSFIVGYIWMKSRVSDSFRIKEIITKGSSAADLSYLKGRSIFILDLKKESEYILESYPDYSKINLVRVLPSRLFVDFVERSPVALVKLYKYFALDNEGFLFNIPGQPEELDLPVILGLETKIFGPKAGKSYNIREVSFALDTIREIKKNKILKNYKIKKFDVATRANAAVFFSLPQAKAAPNPAGRRDRVAPEALLEVRLGADNMEDKIAILGGIFAEGKFDLNNIKYIDLRFKGAVVKNKDAK